MLFHLADDRFGQGRLRGQVGEERLHAPQPPRPFVDAAGIAQHRQAGRVVGRNLGNLLRRLQHRGGQGLDLGHGRGRRQRRVHAIRRPLDAGFDVGNAPLVEHRLRRSVAAVQTPRVFTPKTGPQRIAARVGPEKLSRAAFPVRWRKCCSSGGLKPGIAPTSRENGIQDGLSPSRRVRRLSIGRMVPWRGLAAQQQRREKSGSYGVARFDPAGQSASQVAL